MTVALADLNQMTLPAFSRAVGETFELAAAARDRFLFEIAMGAPTDDGERARLLFDPAFHDVDRLLEAIPGAVADYRELPTLARAIQSHVGASRALELTFRSPTYWRARDIQISAW